MKAIAFLLSLFLLTSCSNPDTSGGVTLSRDVGDGHPGHWPFPDGSCSDQHDYSATNTGCGWVHHNEDSYYIMPDADLMNADLTNAHLTGADLMNADLRGVYLWSANLSGADLNDADLDSVKADSRTICPNGKPWGTAGNNCPF
jgi:hypothetical protein